MGHALRAAVEGGSAMVDGEALVWEISHQIQRILDLPGRHQQIKRQIQGGELRQARAPTRIGHPVTISDCRSGRVRMPTDNVADANHPLAAGERFKIWLDPGAAQIGKGHIARGNAVRTGQGIKPFDLAHRIGGVPVCLDMHAGHHVKPFHRPQVILRQA